MNRFRKILGIIAVICMLVTSVIPAFAEVTGYVTEKDGVRYEYNKDELIDSIIEGGPAYQKYLSETLIAVKDSIKGYIDADDVINAIVDASIEGKTIDVDEYTESEGAKAIEVGDTKLVDKDGNVKDDDEFKVIEISAVDANTILVKFEGEGAPAEAVEITAFTPTPLVNGANAVTFTYVGKEFTETVNYEAPAALEVVGVSAIDINGVTVEVAELAADIEGATVVVKDSKGNVVEVEPVDLSAGETTVDFAFVEEVDEADLVGIWTVDGVEYNLSLVTQLATFEATTSQIELFELLGEMGIENVETANAAAYLSERDGFIDELAANDEELTVAAIQGFVNDVNAAQVTEEEKEAAAQAVVDALGNNIELKAALAAFDKVNNAWIEDVSVGTPATIVDGYATELGAGGGHDLAAIITGGATVTAADVQAGVDAVNEAVIARNITELNIGAISGAAAPAATSVDKAKLTSLKTMIETYAPVDADGEYVTAANQTALDNIEEQVAVADVLAATTASKFKSTVTTLAGIVNTASTTTVDLDEYVDANGKAYIDRIVNLNSDTPTALPTGYTVAGKINTATEIQTVIDAVNEEEDDDAVVGLFGDLEEAVDAVITATTPTATQKAKYVAALNALEIEQVSSDKANVDEYITTDGSTLTADLIKAAAAIVTDSANAGATPDPTAAAAQKTAIQNAIDAANLAVVQNATTEAGIIAALNVMEIENVVAANAAAYVTSAADSTAGEIGAATDAPTLQAAVNAINQAEAVDAAVDAINDATTAAEVKVALDTLADNGEATGYLDVTAADRIFIAEQVLDARDKVTAPVAKEFAAVGDVNTAVGNAATARTNAISAVNTLAQSASLTDIAKALLLVGHEDLTGTWDGSTGNVTANDTAIADAFIASMEWDDATPSAITPQFRSISEIRAAIDAVL